MSARILIVLGVASLALGAAGCGPSAEERFREEQLQPVERRIEQRKAQISGQLRIVHLGRRADARAIAAQVASLDRAVHTMAALRAPGSVASTFRRYVAAHRRLVSSLGRFATLLAGHSRSALAQQASVTQEAAGQIARSRAALESALGG